MDLISRHALAVDLGLSRKAVQTLIDVGYVRNPVRSGRQVLVTREEANRLAAVPFVTDTDIPALLVKVNRALPDGRNGRAWQGWKPDVPATDLDQMNGVRQWWVVRDPNRYVGNLLVPIAAGFVLAVYSVLEYDTVPGGARSFKIKLADVQQAKPFAGKRVPAKAGSFTEPR